MALILGMPVTCLQQFLATGDALGRWSTLPFEIETDVMEPDSRTQTARTLDKLQQPLLRKPVEHFSESKTR